ncbi:MAG: hypothetical protein LBI54_05540 [Lachnospiraceae bacterium]|jgi:predicted ABC-type ATPase|nr:hypothetical protein [Lachnospiraceae bacterium]
MKKPIFTLIAGINGAGKSTYYKTMNVTDKETLGIRISPDELALEYGNLIIGGKAAIKLRVKCFKEKSSCHQETTFTGKSILKSIDEARLRGYVVNIIYINVVTTEIAIKRVADRTRVGGHNIPTADIIRRHPESLKNLNEQIYKFDSVRLIDNTYEYTSLFEYADNDIVFIEDELPQWADAAVTNLQKYLNG